MRRDGLGRAGLGRAGLAWPGLGSAWWGGVVGWSGVGWGGLGWQREGMRDHPCTKSGGGYMCIYFISVSTFYIYVCVYGHSIERETDRERDVHIDAYLSKPVT